ncbi:MAG: YdcF family protein [Lachnospiraceae bacterium]|nr:YdcF family protein [Lachnospiraceae bacterium]
MEWKIILITAGILLILYGAAVAAIGSGTVFFLVWVFLGALGILAGILFASGMTARIPAAIRWTFPAVLLAGVVILGVCTALIGTRFAEKGEKGLDYLIVLGAQVRENGPSAVLKFRLDAAAAYLKDNEGTLCIVSGGKGYNEPISEAEGMKRYLEEAGIDPRRIVMEDQSSNTTENIAFSMKLIKDPGTAGIGIVTNNFHLFRAMAIAQKAGIRNVRGIAAGSSAFYLPNNVLRECLGILKDKLQGNL